MERFGRYVLMQRVGGGGMAEVFRAATLGAAGFARQVAVKRILPHFTAMREFVNMFIDEARIASLLHHPAILPVLDLGEEQGSYFMAMEYVAGASHRATISALVKRKLPAHDALACHVALNVLQALEHAHSRRDGAGRALGIIHRDVSPHNVLLGFDGRVRLADFGIARARDRLVLTVSGGVKGKYGYMAPEQALGINCDGRVDLYAVGVMLHEALTHRPFRRFQTAGDVIDLVARGAYTPLKDLRPGLPGRVHDVVARALEPDPERRWTDAASFAEAVRDVVKREGWEMDGAAVASLMGRLLPARRDAEEQATAYFDELARALAMPTDGTPASIRSGERAYALDDTANAPAPRGEVTRGRSATLVDIRALPAPQPLPEEEAWDEDHARFSEVDATRRGNDAALGDELGADATIREALVLPPDEAIADPTIREAPRDFSLGAAAAPRPAQSPSSPPARVPSADWPRRVTLVLGLVAAVGVSSLGWLLWSSNAPTTPRAIAPLPAPAPAPSTPPSVPAPESARPEAEPASALEPESTREPRSRPKPTTTRPAPAKGTGFLSVQSYPWTRVLVDGKDLKVFTPLVGHPLPAGRHTLELRNDEDKVRWRTEIVVKAGRTVNIQKRFRQ